ncbi:trypsin-like peptidase domain-containing protein [Asticcacaulis solisilvae]|uniref:trypsin-like peptidase domain-containing protein n=1 Tax=Asticcacaulis solisilvae TaxID=1217274 RepID=UPI003FD7EF32
MENIAFKADRLGGKDVVLTPGLQVTHCTTKIETFAGGKPLSTATGFWFRFVDDLGGTHCLVTNKHVVANAETMVVALHLKNSDGSPSKEVVEIEFDIDSVAEHPDDKVDLCAVSAMPLIEEIHKLGRSPFITTCTMADLPSREQWIHYDAIEDIVMVGYPKGHGDQVNRLPLVRRGITSTALAINFDGKPEFVVDMACFPGSSGSPIFLYNANGYYDYQQAKFVGTPRVKLVGVLWGGPPTWEKAIEITGAQSEIYSKSPLHLGFAIRATELMALDGVIRKLVLAQAPGTAADTVDVQ